MYGAPTFDPNLEFRKKVALWSLGASAAVAGVVATFGPEIEATWHTYADELTTSFQKVKTDPELDTTCVGAIEALPNLQNLTREDMPELRAKCGDNASYDYRRYIASKNALDRATWTEAFWVYTDGAFMAASVLGVAASGVATSIGRPVRKQHHRPLYEDTTSNQHGHVKLPYKPKRAL